MVYEILDKVVLITGGASGIGAAVVRVLLEDKVKHIAVLDIDEGAGIALQDELNSKYGVNKVKFFKCDVTNDDQLFGVFKTTTDEHGYIDVVINNAGIMNDDLSVYKKEIEINMTALVAGTLKSLELMRKDEGGKGGTVINISSIAGITQADHLPIYWATKSAVLQFSNCIGLEHYYSKTDVRVLTICFGATTTPLISAAKLGSFDKETGANLEKNLNSYPKQSEESAARGLAEAYKLGESGSTWLVANNEPARDITANIKKAYGVMSEHVFI